MTTATTTAHTLPADPFMPWWFDLIAFAPVLVVAFIIFWFARHGYSSFGFVKKQSDFLDHQKDVSTKALEQSKTFEEMIAKQYAESNERSDKALAQSEEAIRLHAAALEQLAELNATMSRLAHHIEGEAGPAPGAAAT